MTGFRGSNIPKTSHMNEASHWFLSELTHRIVAETGIPDDRYHLGKIILQSLKDDTRFLLQINGATGDSENFGSVLHRTVQCANSLRKLGIKTAELEDTFRIDCPKVIFCQNERLSDVFKASKRSGIHPEVITFDKGDQVLSFAYFLENVSVEDFRPADFDPSTTIAISLCTSGTTGKPKSAAIAHKSFAISMPSLWSKFTTFPTPTKLAIIVAPLQWLSAIMSFLFAPVFRYTRLQSSLPATQEHTYNLINKYRPSYMIISPTMMTTLIKPGDRDKCDFTCFETILIGGSAVHENLIEEVKKLSPTAEVYDVYGMSETTTIIFWDTYANSPPGSCGKPTGFFQYRLVDPTTGKDINEPNVPGELRVQSQALFMGYFNDPEATKATFEDGWLKTGDIFYRDENWNFFFVDRLKQLLKYKNHQISPVELEGVIRQHPKVMDVAVMGLPDPECGDLPVACVVLRPGQTVKAQEIKNLVRDTLTDTKQLRGGVIFLNELPMTATTKLHRQKLQEIVLNSPRE